MSHRRRSSCPGLLSISCALLAATTSSSSQQGSTGSIVNVGAKPTRALPALDCVFPHRIYPVSDPVSYRFGHVDGDGILDVVVASEWGFEDGYVSVRLGLGDGTFGDELALTPTFDPQDLVLVDLDANGTLDIVAGNAVSEVLTVFLGNGDGTFGVATEYPLGGETLSMARGHFVGNDGLTDVVVVDSGEVLVYENMGTGALGTPTTLVIPGLESSSHVLTQDFNGDGHRDILLPRESSLSLWFGDSAGGFVLTEPSLVTAALADARAADMDGDGDPDLVTVDDAAITIYDNAAGTFTAQAPVLPTGVPFFPLTLDLGVGDWNGDGHTDVAVEQTGQLRFFQNDGAGNLSLTDTHTQVSLVFLPGGVDVEQDGDTDFVSLRHEGGLQILLNDGQGLVSADYYPVDIDPKLGGLSVATGDLNGDSILDVVAAAGEDSAYLVYLGVGGGAFGAPVSYDLLDHSISSPELADMDGDGLLDLVMVRHHALEQVCVHLGNGDGTFGDESYVDMPGSDLYAFLLRDLDGDGDTDVLARLDGLRVLLNAGDGTLVHTQSVSVTGAAGFAAGDIDGDGDQDAVIANSQFIEVHANDGQGTLAFDAGYGFIGPDMFGGPALADWDGDGWLDMAWTYRDSNLEYQGAFRFNDGAGGFQPYVTFPSDRVHSLVGKDINGDGAPDLMGTNFSEWSVVVHKNLNTGSQTDVFGPPLRHTSVRAGSLHTANLEGGMGLDLLIGSSEGFEVLFADCE